MTNAEKKQFLSQYYKARLRIKIIREQIEELETLAAGGSINVSDLPSGKNNLYDPVRENAVKIADLITELEREEELVKPKAIAVVEAIKGVENETEYAILTLRYVKCMHWEDIAKQLGYSEIRAYEIHDRALTNLQISQSP